MLDRIKQIPARMLELWKKYTKKQRTIFLSIVGTVILMLIIMIMIFSRINYIDVYTFDTTQSAGAALALLQENGIATQIADDRLTVQADATKETEALILIAASYTDESEFTLTDYLSNDLTTTNSDRKLKDDLYMKTSIQETLKGVTGIEDATVIYYPTGTNTSILSSEENISCGVTLTINSFFNTDNAENIAIVIAASLGNSGTDDIKIMDQNGTLLFGGPVDEEVEASSAKLQYISDVTDFYSEIMRQAGIKNHFDDAEVSLHLDINYDEENVVYKEYLAGDGLEQGLYSTYNKISSTNTTASGDIPGTDSNSATDYYIADTSSGDSSYDEVDITYIPSERLTNTVKELGVIDPSTSTVSVTLNKVTVVYESDLQLLGTLNNMTFDQYIAQNRGVRTMDPTEYDYLYDIMYAASSIPVANIRIVAYESYDFVPMDTTAFDWAMFFRILLAVVIFGLLVFIVLRSMAPEKVVEMEPELSVEQLLATTKENQTLEDIEFSEKSETRRMIEKFVDENPEAVANLMRNWLSED